MKLCKPFGVLEASRTGKYYIFILKKKWLSVYGKITKRDSLFIYLFIFIGVMAMPRSPVHDHYEPQTEHSYEEEGGVDATMLPPG